MDFERARFNMVEQQIRPWDVLSPQVLDAVEQIPRHQFVAESQQTLAYMDLALPIGEGQRMMEPRLEARMVQSIDLQKHETVLEIGTGSGYVTALLCALGASVRSIDCHASFIEQAKARLTEARIGNFILENGDAMNVHWGPGSHYDVVVLTGAVSEVPQHLQSLVKTGGRLFAVIDRNGVKQATLMNRIDDQNWLSEVLFETDVDNLISPATETFTF